MTAKASEPVETAKTPVTSEKMPSTIQVVEFVLGSEHFAIDLFDVKEVVEYTTITKLPNVPVYVRGIIDLRGEITMIIDLKHRLNISEESSTALESSRIIVLDDKIAKSKTSILVDDVTSVSTFEGNQVDYTSSFRKQTGDIHHRDHQAQGPDKRQGYQRTDHLDRYQAAAQRH